MDNPLVNSDLELGKFGEYMLRSRIVHEKYARYYVGWVRKFLSQPGHKPVGPAGIVSAERRVACRREVAIESRMKREKDDPSTPRGRSRSKPGAPAP